MQKNHFLTILILIGMFLLSAVPIKSQTELKDEMRMPWATSQKDFFREWLALGGFPNQDGKGFDTDFLQEHGGEANISPVEGMSHKLPNGLTFEW